MGFFKDFKDDFSQAVNELIPNNDAGTNDVSDQMVNTLDSEITTSNEDAENELKEWLDELVQEDTIEDGILEDEISEDAAAEDTIEDEAADEDSEDEDSEDEDSSYGESLSAEEGLDDNIEKEIFDEFMEDEIEGMDENIDLELLDELNSEDEQVMEQPEEQKLDKRIKAASVANEDDVTVISKGTTINGSISSDGSLDIMGSITGDVECLGKLSITGKIVGNSTAAEVYVNTERMEGSINSEGSVKVGLGTVVIGDIIATSGVIAGAVKGEIDVNGPVVIDSTAIIKGNIKAKSVQINNGAVIEGFCSLSYSDIDVDNVFE